MPVCMKVCVCTFERKQPNNDLNCIYVCIIEVQAHCACNYSTKRHNCNNNNKSNHTYKTITKQKCDSEIKKSATTTSTTAAATASTSDTPNQQQISRRRRRRVVDPPPHPPQLFTTTTSRVGRRVRLPVHLATSVTATIRTGASSTLGPRKLRSLRNLLSRDKRRHLRMRSANSGSGSSSGSGQPQQRQNIINSDSDQSSSIDGKNNNTNAIQQSEDAMKEKQHDTVTKDKNVGEAEQLDEVTAEGGELVNGAAVESYKSENKPPPATTQPAHEKMLYDTRIRRKNVLALNEKVAAIREYEKSPVYKRVGRIFHCSPDQIKRIVQQKASILEAWQQRTRRCQDAKTLEMKVVRVSMLGKAVFDWLRRMIYYQDIQITDGLIQKTALQFKSAMGLQNFFPHQDWCDKFRQTYKIHTTDSKLLKIGYTQGYSVQIKDVMKDVLNECTPDAGKVQPGDNDNDDDDDDDVVEIKEECEKAGSTNDKEGAGDEELAAKRMRTNAIQSSAVDNASLMSTGTLNAPGNAIINRINISSSNLNASNRGMENKSATQPAMQKVTPLPQLQPLRQLVALPLQGNVAGMPQKVLVATPITPAGQVQGAKPMTMTIIPLTTIAQSQSMQAASVAASATAATANALTAALATTTATAATPVSDAEKSNVPPPMFDIKKEIKQEPVEIKQEYISDTEGAEDEKEAGKKQQQQITPNTLTATGTQNKCNKRSTNAFTADDEDASSSNSATDMEETIAGADSGDDENIALANLRRLIQTQGKVVATAPATTASMPPTTTAATVPPLAPKPILTPATITPITTAIGDGPHLPASTTAITCIPAANLSAMTRSSSFTPPLPPLTKAPDAVINRLANKRKHNASNMPMLPPIKSCSEARKYLKLLEDFALVKENFRLIGLITRADEVLRELDGDDDVDVD